MKSMMRAVALILLLAAAAGADRGTEAHHNYGGLPTPEIEPGFMRGGAIILIAGGLILRGLRRRR